MDGFGGRFSENLEPDDWTNYIYNFGNCFVAMDSAKA